MVQVAFQRATEEQKYKDVMLLESFLLHGIHPEIASQSTVKLKAQARSHFDQTILLASLSNIK